MNGHARGYTVWLLVAVLSIGFMFWRYQYRIADDSEKQMLAELSSWGWHVRMATPLLGGTYINYQLLHPRCDGALQAMVLSADQEAMSVSFALPTLVQGIMFQGQRYLQPPLLVYRLSQGWRKLWGLSPYPFYRVALPESCLSLIGEVSLAVH
ncbi:hypothetical protein [Aeromonas cavernicola]|uniref:Uncharacterized protein n=1 Tax=Aeromonas cavernicola TaxID=1006623 RepID=A0A2H9U819_9GAMM|nr:hypothetical protein [Aeromonas cavernicola]PJG60148.1 hypothetical protein CUC53_03360 [Aeromonas cavernicola]